jgi:hypothetical protein
MLVVVFLLFVETFTSLPARSADETDCSDVETTSYGLVIRCTPGYATPSDRIELYNKVDSVLPEDRMQWFRSTVALFFVGDADRPSLLIDFSEEANHSVARIFQDVTDDGMVDYVLENGNPRATEGDGRPAIVVRTVDGGWWGPNGTINYDLHIEADGPIKGMIDFGIYESLLKTDGTTDLTIDVRDANGNGRPEVEWRQAYPPLPGDSGHYRTSVMANTNDNEQPVANAILWPHLGTLVSDLVKGIGPSPPPIQVDWRRGRVSLFHEFVGSRLPGHYFVYSINRITPGTVGQANFENPFVFFDLSGTGDGNMDMSIRFVHFYAGDPFGWRRRSDVAFTHAMYTWDQQHDQRWDYEIAVMNDAPMTDVIQAGDLRFESVEYNRAPQWVTQQSWKAAIFVEVNLPHYFNPEHVYEWSGEGSPLDRCYLQGLCDEDLQKSAYFSDTPAGFRGEIAVPFDRRPELYFSPIDRRLHLVGANFGVWNVDGHQRFRYQNLGGGTAIDGWQFWEGGALKEQLYQVPGGLLYSDDQETLFVEADIPTELFRTLPPTSHEEWEKLGELLHASGRDSPPENLRAMFDQFGDDQVLIARGPLADFARDGENVSFTVRADDAETQRALNSLAGEADRTGLQVVARTGDRWTATTARLVAPAIAIGVTPGSPFDTVPVDITIANDGALALQNARLTVQAVAADGRTGVVLGSSDVEVTGGSEQALTFPWAPGQPGTWTLRTTLTRASPDARTGEQVVLAQYEQTVEVRQADTVSPNVAARLAWSGPIASRVFAILGVLGLIGVCAAVTLSKGLRVR